MQSLAAGQARLMEIPSSQGPTSASMAPPTLAQAAEVFDIAMKDAETDQDSPGSWDEINPNAQDMPVTSGR